MKHCGSSGAKRVSARGMVSVDLRVPTANPRRHVLCDFEALLMDLLLHDCVAPPREQALKPEEDADNVAR